MDNLISTQVLMQHHGAPTRLLDWTRSVWIAAYFACCSHMREPGSVYAFSPSLLFDSLSPETRQAARCVLAAEGLEDYKSSPDDLPELVLPVSVVESTPRMVIQQTEFTWSHPANLDHLDWLGKQTPASGRAIVAIPASLKSGLMQRLMQMNCTAEALFPTLDGAGRFLSECMDCELSVPNINLDRPRSPS